MADPVTCKIDFNAADRPRSVRMLVGRLARLAEASGPSGYSIDLTRCQYLGPDAAAILGAVILDLRNAGKQVVVAPPAGPPELRSFFGFSGLESIAASGTINANLKYEENKSILPLIQVHRARFQDADPILRMLQHHETPNPELDEYLRVCVNEVLQNVQDHAASPIGGLMAARFLTKDREVRVAIVDRGRGMCTTLRQRWPDTTPDNVMSRVLEGSYTALSRENNLGLGLSNLANIIRNQGGSLFIVSEISTVEVAPSGTDSLRRLRSNFAGTGVFFTLPVAG